MKIYLTAGDIISDMHLRGFTDDFELIENRLLWVQTRVFLEHDEFAIVECHCFLHASGTQMIISGVVSLNEMGKGILINHCSESLCIHPAIIECKIAQLYSIASEKKGEYVKVY